jgi:hypothetical protein
MRTDFIDRRRRFLTDIDKDRIRRLLDRQIAFLRIGPVTSVSRNATVESWVRTKINFERTIEEG